MKAWGRVNVTAQILKNNVVENRNTGNLCLSKWQQSSFHVQLWSSRFLSPMGGHAVDIGQCRNRKSVCCSDFLPDIRPARLVAAL
jgi:hypothetical protein